jgi:omega-amidase
MENLKIVAIQYDIVWENKSANFKKLEAQFFSKFKPNTHDLILLPEMFATGFTMNPSAFYEEEDGETFVWLKERAKQTNACIGAGIIMSNKNGGFLNTFAIVRPDGNLEYYYKRHLFRMGEENRHYVSGNTAKIIEINGWKINLQVCYDLRFPTFARNAINDKSETLYDVLVYIANWPEVRTAAWTALLRARAIENQAYVCGVNRVGKDGNQVNHSGASAIINPLGGYLCDTVYKHEVAIESSLNFEDLSKARTVFPVLLDADRFIITDK